MDISVETKHKSHSSHPGQGHKDTDSDNIKLRTRTLTSQRMSTELWSTTDDKTVYRTNLRISQPKWAISNDPLFVKGHLGSKLYSWPVIEHVLRNHRNIRTAPKNFREITERCENWKKGKLRSDQDRKTNGSEKVERRQWDAKSHNQLNNRPPLEYYDVFKTSL